LFWRSDIIFYMKNIFIVTIILSIINLSVLGIMRVAEFISGDSFISLLSDSFLIILIVFIAASAINFVVNYTKK
jgi:hypothetical protein